MSCYLPPVPNLTALNLSLSAAAKAQAADNLAIPVASSSLPNWLRGGVAGKTIVWWGDSTTLNATTLLGGTPPAVTGGEIGGFHQKPGEALEGATSLNYGTNGATLAAALTTGAYNLDAVIAAHPDLAIVCFGLNDVRAGATSAAQLTALLASAVNRLRAALPACDIVLWGPNSLLASDPGGTGYVTATGLYSGMSLAQAAQAATDILRNGYAALANKWPNVVVVQKQDVFDAVAHPASMLMSDILHPSQLGQVASAAQIVRAIGYRRPFSADLAAAARSASAMQPYGFYPREVEDSSKYDLVASGRWTAQGGMGSNGFLDFGFPGPRGAAEIAAGDIVEMGNGAYPSWAIPAGFQALNQSANVTRLFNLGASLPTATMTGGTISIWRHKYGFDPNVESYWTQKAAYPSRRRFIIGSAGNGYADLFAMPGEPLATLTTPGAADTLIATGVAPKSLAGASFASVGNALRVLLSGTDFSSAAGLYGFLFSPTYGRFYP